MVPSAQVLAKQAVGVRWVASVIDLMIVFTAWACVRYALLAVAPVADRIGGPALLVTAALGFFYYIVPEILIGASPGKLIVGARLVDIYLKPATPKQVAVRSLELLAWVVLLGLIFLLVQVWLSHSKGQGMGDLVAKTYVVKAADVAPKADAPPASS
jgi:uncharacterized RDD family membrane protein YckC